MTADRGTKAVIEDVLHQAAAEVITWAAWRETRVAKVHRSLAELTEEWTARAQPFVGDQPASWAQSLLGRTELAALRSDERAKMAERALAHGLAMAVKLSPPELTYVPERFRAPDGSSQFSPSGSWTYTTVALLEAEARLLAAGRDTSGPTLGFATVAQVRRHNLTCRSVSAGGTSLASGWVRSQPPQMSHRRARAQRS